MPRCHATEEENDSPLGGARAERPWGGCEIESGTHPVASRLREVFSRLHLRATPPREGIFRSVP